jgi:hypothetical protein
MSPKRSTIDQGIAYLDAGRTPQPVRRAWQPHSARDKI